MLFLKKAAGLRFRFQVLGFDFTRTTDSAPQQPRPWPRSCRCIAWFSVCGAVTLLIALRPSPAGASCTPDPANNGATVTCSGADNNGFNSASTNLTVDVLSGASVSVGNGLSAIGLTSGNTITNDGSIAAGALGSGILANANNIITNNGSVIAGANGFSIQTIGTGNTVINNGTLDGILSLAGANNSITNWGLITITNAGTSVGASQVVGGDYIQMSGAALASRVNAASGDTLSVSGTATLNGALRITVQPGLYANSTNYLGVINAANPIVTQFESLSSSSAFLTASAIYNANSVDVVLTRIPFGAVAGLSPNQRAVGNALEKVYSPSVSGGAATLYSNLLAVSSPLALNQLSGEGITAAQQSAFLANSQFVSLLSGRMTFDPASAVFKAPAGAVHALGYSAGPTAGYDGVVTPPPLLPIYGPPPAPHSWVGWGAAFGGRQTVSGDSVNGSVSQDTNVLGGAIGGELRTEFGSAFGFALGGSHSTFSATDRATDGSADAGHIGLYAAHSWNEFYLAGVVSFSQFQNKTTRTISGVGPSETATGRFDSQEFGSRFEAGYRIASGSLNITPFAAVQFSEIWQQRFTEASMTAGGAPGVLGLTFPSVTTTSLPTFLGMQFDTKIAMFGGPIFAPYLRVSWVHEFNPDRSIGAYFNSVPGASFVVDGPRVGSDSAKIDLGMNLAFNRQLSLFGNFNSEVSSRGHSYAGQGGVRFVW